MKRWSFSQDWGPKIGFERAGSEKQDWAFLWSPLSMGFGIWGRVMNLFESSPLVYPSITSSLSLPRLKKVLRSCMTLLWLDSKESYLTLLFSVKRVPRVRITAVHRGRWQRIASTLSYEVLVTEPAWWLEGERSDRTSLGNHNGCCIALPPIEPAILDGDLSLDSIWGRLY